MVVALLLVADAAECLVVIIVDAVEIKIVESAVVHEPALVEIVQCSNQKWD